MGDEELTPYIVRLGVENGAFPMTDEDGEINWYRSSRRALFPISGMHVSRSLRKTIRSGIYRVTFDQAFEAVMRGCLRPPEENWISEPLIQVYTQIHYEGWGHSVEVWREDELVGGVYGLAIGACFSAESMFHRATDASKVGLWALIERCRELGFELFDAQYINDHTASLGAYEVSDLEYRCLLEAALRKTTVWSAR